jgi:MFS family permease
MSSTELRATLSLASIFALRMLGLFLIMPVFALHAHSLPGEQSTVLIGLALGIYGLTQACLQIPLGAASDRYGRKPVIFLGLTLFVLGAVVAALSTTLWGVVVGRALQGAGAISAAITALIADSTRDENRTKAMAVVGASIGLTFALSLVLGPLLYAQLGMNGLFLLMAALGLGAMAVVVWVVPNVALPLKNKTAKTSRTPWRTVLRHPELLRLNLGIFTLHLVQTALFVVVPGLLVQYAALPLPQHWQVYLPVVLGSFVFMLPLIWLAEKRGHFKRIFSASIALLLLVQVLFATLSAGLPANLPVLMILLLGFFTGFNFLETSLPSLISKIAPPQAKGAALGVYNTTQSLGLFAGGALGGWVSHQWGTHAVFFMAGACLALWLLVSTFMRTPPLKAALETAQETSFKAL